MHDVHAKCHCCAADAVRKHQERDAKEASAVTALREIVDEPFKATIGTITKPRPEPDLATGFTKRSNDEDVL